MFIHLGGDTLVSTKNIVIIMNLENNAKSNITNEYLKKAEERKLISKLEGNVLKSVVVTEKTIYLSPISSTTLKKRAKFVDNL